MKTASSALFALVLCAPFASAQAQAPAPAAPNPAAGVSVREAVNYKISYVRVGNEAEALLYEPTTLGPKSRIALVFSHPNRDTFSQAYGPELAARGYRVLTINYRGDSDAEAFPESYLPSISRGFAFMRTLPGVQKVLAGGHSGGGHQMALYTNVAENGPGACSGPEKIIPCDTKDLAGLQKPDGVVFLDATIGAGHAMSSVDPAVSGEGRDPALDMFATQNGYDRNAKKAKYTPEFAKKFYAAQAARNKTIVDAAIERAKVIKDGKGQFSNDEAFVVSGIGVRAAGARLYQADTSLASRTKKPYLLLKADGTNVEAPLVSVRPPLGQNVLDDLKTLYVMNMQTTVRRFLANQAIRTTPDFAFTEDDIVGVDWASSYTSTVNNAKGITVPTVIVSMTCHYLMVPDELIFNNLASKDKTFAGVEGATHGFTPCRPEYGNTTKRLFDYVDSWVSKEGRF